MNDDQERGDSSPNTGRQSTVNVNGDSKCEEKAFSANLIWPAFVPRHWFLNERARDFDAGKHVMVEFQMYEMCHLGRNARSRGYSEG